MAIIAKYKFDSSLYADCLPIFNAEFTGYTKTDVNNGDGTTTRTISHDTLKPTYMRFGLTGGSATDREKSLLEVIECDTSNITIMHNMFNGCSQLTSLDASSFDTSKVTNMLYAFNGCSKLTSLDLSSFDTSNVTNMNSIFENCKSLTTLNISSWDTSKVTDMAYMFNQCTSLTSLDVSNFDTSKVTNMRDMFNSCQKLTSLNVSNFNTNNVTTMYNMFKSCSNLTSLDVSNFNTSNVTNMNSTFENCSALTSLNVSSFNTIKVTDMAYMFKNCKLLTSLNLSNFNTSQVTNMNSMFNSCSKLTSLDLSNFDTSQVTNMSAIFGGCSLLTSLDVSSFNTSKLTDMSFIFRFCPSLISLDLSNWNTSQVTNMINAFDGCSSLTRLDLSNWNTSKVTNMSHMFNQCPTSDIGLLYATSSTINTLLTHLGTSVARNIYYTDVALDELTVQDNITYKKYELTMATLPYTLNKLPNGVADYIDVVNKVHVQMVGEIVLDGTHTFTYSSANSSAYYYGYTMILSTNEFKTATSTSHGLCDKLKYQRNVNFPWTTDGDYIIIASNQLFIKLSKDKLNSNESVGSLTTYLASNPVTVLYELETPIYTPLTDEEIAQLPLSAYADGSVNLSSDQLMPSFEFRMRASNRYQVDMLETGYYYLNAPVGNVKLGTANVDVQQMPCIVKVDNVGSGDSRYRLKTNSTGGNNITISQSDMIDGAYFNSTDGSFTTNSGMCYSPNYYEILPNTMYGISAPTNMRINLYTENQTYIKTIDGSGAWTSFTTPSNAKLFRFSHNIYSKKDHVLIVNPVTLAKLPSHRIPTSFTQGMKCGTDFGYWEGVMESNPTSFRTVNTSSGWSIVETSEIEGGVGVVLNRIEYGNTIVEDELDIATGKLTKRVGKVILDGSDDEGWRHIDSRIFTNTILFQSAKIIKQSVKNNSCLSNLFKASSQLWLDSHVEEGIGCGGLDMTSVDIKINKSKLSSLSSEGIKKWLQQNPITLYFELAVPEISYPNISLSQVKTVANTAMQCTRLDGYLRAQCKPSHLTYSVPSLVGNREYTVVHNRKNITGSTKPIELNLGGTVVQLNDASSRTLVKTPSSLKHSSLIFIGGESTVDHVMVLDGDWTNKPIEYFENMKGHDTDAIITIIGDGKIEDVAEQYLW